MRTFIIAGMSAGILLLFGAALDASEMPLPTDEAASAESVDLLDKLF